jgi:hypothetical protein
LVSLVFSFSLGFVKLISTIAKSSCDFWLMYELDLYSLFRVNEVSEDIIVAFHSNTSLKVSKHAWHMLEFVLNLNTNYVWLFYNVLFH